MNIPPQSPESTQPPPVDITRVLDALRDGEAEASDQLLEAVYEEMRRIAERLMRNERPGDPLQPTALVHEAYLRLFGHGDVHWDNRAHFFTAATEVMRRVLIDRARKRKAQKRGRGWERAALADAVDRKHDDPGLLLIIDEALQALEADDPRRAQVVKLRFFAGLTAPETAAAMGSTLRTVERDWRYARAWLLSRLSATEE